MQLERKNFCTRRAPTNRLALGLCGPPDSSRRSSLGEGIGSILGRLIIPGRTSKTAHYLTAPCLQSWHFVKRESPRDSSIYLITNPPGLILGQRAAPSVCPSAAVAQRVAALHHANRPSQPVRHFWPLRNQGFFVPASVQRSWCRDWERKRV
jgi:hypothetical protein